MKRNLTKKNAFSLTLLLWKFISERRKKQIKLLMILIIFSSFAEFITVYLLVPYLKILTNPEIIFQNKFFNKVINSLTLNSSENIILLLTLFFIIAIIISGLVRLIFNFYTFKLSSLIGSDLSVRAYMNTINRPYKFHLKTNSSKIVTTIAKDINEIVYYVILPIFQLISAISICLLIFFSLSIINLKVTLSSLFIISLFYLSLFKFSLVKIEDISKRNLKLSQDLVQIAQESLGGIRDIILSHNQSFFTKQYATKDKTFRKETGYGNFLALLPKLIIEPIAIVIIALFGYFIILGEDPNQAIPIMGAITFSGIRLLPFAQRIYEGLTLPRLGKSRLYNLISILENPPFILPNKKLNTRKIILDKNLEIKNLAFKYNDETKPVLDNINLTIKKGEKLGIIGKTGSGKSTLLDLIMGLIEPTSGGIFIDNKSIFDKKAHKLKMNWQNSFMHVPQNINLIDASIAENIAFGLSRDQIDFKRLKEVSKKAELNEFILQNNKGFDSVIGERGVRLSGGQKQRIGIARALYKNSKIIFLDEATSALDEGTEEKIINAFNFLGSEVTLVIITHRINTLRFCDKIYELDSGKLIKKNLF